MEPEKRKSRFIQDKRVRSHNLEREGYYGIWYITLERKYDSFEIRRSTCQMDGRLYEAVMSTFGNSL